MNQMNTSSQDESGFGGLSPQEFWDQVNRQIEEDMKIFDDLISLALRQGWSFFNHVNGRRNGQSAYEGFTVTKRLKVIVRRTNTRENPKTDFTSHTYPMEQVVFAPKLEFLKAVCGNERYLDVAHHALDMPTAHERINLISENRVDTD